MFDDIFSHLDTMHKRDGQTDGRTPDDSKDRAIKRIASRGKNNNISFCTRTIIPSYGITPKRIRLNK